MKTNEEKVEEIKSTSLQFIKCSAAILEMLSNILYSTCSKIVR